MNQQFYDTQDIPLIPTVPTTPDHCRPALADFLPSRHGFRFANAFTPQRLGPLLGGGWTIGLCGGMSFAAMDYFLAGRPVPPHAAPPETGWLLHYLVKRQLHSLHLPGGVWRYYRAMLPGRSRQTLAESVAQEWPRIRRELDAGRPCPVGLIFACTANPLQLVQNHQVLAYGYEQLPGGRIWLRLYDPNYPANDAIALAFGGPAHWLPTHSMGRPVYGFFHTPYRPATPPG